MDETLATLNLEMTAFLHKWSDVIGPRPAGGTGEVELQRQVKSYLSSLGYRIEEHPFSFAPAPVFQPYFTIAAFFLIFLPWFLYRAPLLAVVMPLIPSVLPGLSMWITQKIPRNARSVNLLALPEGVELEKLDWIFCAHTDTARAVPLGSDGWFHFRIQSEGLARRMGWILVIFVVIHLVVFQFNYPIFAAAATLSTVIGVALVIQDVWEQIGSRRKFTPGINDDASGVAVLMALAKYIQSKKPSGNIGFCFTSAEECGLFGAQAFAAELRQADLSPRVVSVDMVGAGDQLRIIYQAGELVTIRADRDLVDLLDRVLPDAIHKRLKTRTGDFAAFIRAGIPACGLESNGTKRSWRAYHTAADDFQIIDPTMLEQTLHGLTRLVEWEEPSESDEGSVNHPSVK
jgi:hypothetical protein